MSRQRGRRPERAPQPAGTRGRPASTPGQPAGTRGQRPVPGRPGGERSVPWVLGLGAIAVVAVALLAVALTQGGSGPSGGSSTTPPASGSPTTAARSSLPPFAGPGDDPAVGQLIPEVTGQSFDGSPVAIDIDGRPKLLLFLAHWCPHCQREVPVVQAWLDAGRLPEGVELISIVTSINPNLPNYPPDAWLAREHWTAPVLVDADGSVALRFGLTAFPYWVAVDAEGRVVARLTGELTADQLDALAASVRG